MSMFSKLGSFFSIRDEDEDLYEDEPAPSGRVVPLSSAGRRPGAEVSVYSPRSFQDVILPRVLRTPSTAKFKSLPRRSIWWFRPVWWAMPRGCAIR